MRNVELKAVLNTSATVANKLNVKVSFAGGNNGGSGDMLKSVYDPENRAEAVAFASDIPEGMRLIADVEITEPITLITINEDFNGNPFELTECRIEYEASMVATTTEAPVDQRFIYRFNDFDPDPKYLFRFSLSTSLSPHAGVVFQSTKGVSYVQKAFFGYDIYNSSTIQRLNGTRETSSPYPASFWLSQEKIISVRFQAVTSRLGIGTKIKIYGK